MKILILFYLIIFICPTNAFSTNNDSNYITLSLDSLGVNLGDDEEIKMKLYLAEKYHPGNCFGMPGPELPIYQRKISQELLSKVKRLVPEKSNKECEVIIREMQMIGLENKDIGKYYFEFKDGQCCNIIYYKGFLQLRNNEIIEELFEKTVKNVPC